MLLYVVLHSEGAGEATVRELIETTPDPAGVVWRLWRTRKIPHRLLVVEYLKAAALTQPALCRQMRPLLLEAALDADMDTREQALGALEMQKDPSLADLARLQLRDPDPNLRMLGLQYLRKVGDRQLTPELIGLLEDPDPRVIATTDSLLRTWTSNDFGLRIKTAIPEAGENSNAPLEPAKVEVVKQAVLKWQDWWRANQGKFGSVKAISPELDPAPSRLSAGDFSLEDLAGHRVHLSDYRGKTVFLNFWATWCTACLMETPDLVQLQKRGANDLVILAVCLDGRPEEDEHEAEGREESNPPTTSARDRAEIRKKVARLVKSKGINYPVVLDPTGEIGARFNGQELPTNVILDPDGEVRRRFIGTRAASALERMLREAGKPAKP